MQFRRAWLLVAVLVWGHGVPGRAEESPRGVPEIALPQREPIPLRLVAKLGPGPGKENSGIVRSRQFPDTFWVENDSGDEPKIYAIHRDGKDYGDERYPEQAGTLIGGAINVDWEDITVDASGHVIVADLGNNGNDRRDLVLYYIDEPAPGAGRTTFKKKVFVRYPDQAAFPAPQDNFNFDCVAVFTVGDTLHLLSKNRSDTNTTLYRLDNPKTEETNVLTKLGTFTIGGQAVGADCSADGNRLVVITYQAIWLFERKSHEEDFFQAKIRWAPYQSQQCEAVCFADDETLLLGDEDLGRLLEAKVQDLTLIRE